jgi:hypothetical protein
MVVVLATDAWVYTDAKERYDRGTPVVFSTGALEVGTPTAWFLGCLILWILFFPLYITRRGQAR